MAGLVNNVANLRRVVVGFKGHETYDKPKIADFFTCLVHHFSPNELSTIINCGIQSEMLVLYSPTKDGKYNNLKAENGFSIEYETVTLHVCLNDVHEFVYNLNVVSYAVFTYFNNFSILLNVQYGNSMIKDLKHRLFLPKLEG